MAQLIAHLPPTDPPPRYTSDEVEMKVGEILRKYGEKLSQEQKADIRKVMAENQDGLEKIRAFVLLNGDQPATVYRPYRKEGKK